MKSYLIITTNKESGVVEIKASLNPTEVCELACIRHYVVEKITKIIQPECEKVTFKLGE